MRGEIDGLASAAPLGATLPGIYQDDDFTQRMVDAFDQVLAPILCTLDNIEAYFDPSLAPSDFAEWLASWVGLVLDESWPQDRRRSLVARSHEVFRWRGTARGLAEHVSLYTGVIPEVAESGGSSWSPTPGGELPGRAAPELTLTVRVADPSVVDTRTVEAIVAFAKPAHLKHRVKVVSS